jgi:D-beta-D-heptose 7-phosphate kinase/D-beta-D-heptose 1-phosphate adenosyltransferase
LGVIGKDRDSEDFRSLLSESGISDSHLVVDSSRRTILKERVVSERQQLLRIDYESPHAMSRAMENEVLQKFEILLPECDGIIVEDYAKGLLSESVLQGLVVKAKQAGKTVAVDPNWKTPVSLYRGADILTPNLREAEQLAGVMIRDQPTLMEAGFSILKTASAQSVIVTLGKDGMAVFTRGSHSVRLIPTTAREVYDVSGAGDTVIAVLTLAVVSGATIEEASILGNLAAGVEVAKRGTATVSPEEIRAALELCLPRG